MRRHFLLMLLLTMLSPMVLSAATIRLPETGQTFCLDTAVNRHIPCTDPLAAGQDGAIRAGVSWPEQRFVDNGNGTISDNFTGLIWAKDMNIMVSRNPSDDLDQGWDETPYDGKVNWQHALDYVADLNREYYLGFNDWQLPNVTQLNSLADHQGDENHCTSDGCDSWLASAGFINVPKYKYYGEGFAVDTLWSSSTFAGYSDSAWIFAPFFLEGISLGDKYSNSLVWPVRAKPLGSSGASLPRTGQTTSYAVGDDGDYKQGVAWPTPRFANNGNGTVVDNLTGLIWARDGNIMASRDPYFDVDGSFEGLPGDGKVTRQHALDYVAKLNQEQYLGFKDWRLPNATELASLNNFQRASRASWLNGAGFVNVQDYYSSSTYGTEREYHHNYVWPVRAGLGASELLVAKDGTGSGNVMPDSGNLVWTGSTGTAAYPETDVVTLTAIPAAGSTFDGWSGACTGVGACQVRMNANQRVTATFNRFVAAPPASIVAPSADADGNYTVRWEPSSTTGVTYELQEAINPNFMTGLRTVYSGSGLNTVISGRSLNLTYYYRARAKKSGYLDSPWKTSSSGCAIPGSTITPAPTSLTLPASDTDGSFAVSWGASPVAGVTYVLEEATNPTFSDNLVTAYTGVRLNANISGRLQNKTYYYRVKAVRSGFRDSAWRLPIKGCAVPGAGLVNGSSTMAVPTNVPDGPYTVSWWASETAGASYLLEEATDSAFSQGLRTAYFGTATSKTISGRIPGKTYYYRVQAVKAGMMDSGKRVAANGCRVIMQCASPANVTVPLADADGIYTISWKSSATAGAGYEVQEAINSTFTAGLRTVYGGAALSVNVTGRGQSVTYYYRVRATKNGNTASSWCNALNGCAVPGMARVLAPANLTLPESDTDGNYTINWGASATAGVIYELQESSASNFSADLRIAYRGMALACNIAGRSQNVTYYYRVRAVKAGLMDSAYRVAANSCAVPGVETVYEPRDITVPETDLDGNYNVGWGFSGITGATYELQEATDSNFTTGLRTAYRGTALSASITGRNSGNTYYYRVRAVKGGLKDSAYRAAANGCAVP